MCVKRNGRLQHDWSVGSKWKRERKMRFWRIMQVCSLLHGKEFGLRSLSNGKPVRGF